MKDTKVNKGDWVILEKISDDKFNGVHLNGIDKGYIQIGELMTDINIGERVTVLGKRMHDYLNTSNVIEIIDDNIFKTENSTYKIEIYENYT